MKKLISVFCVSVLLMGCAKSLSNSGNFAAGINVKGLSEKAAGELSALKTAPESSEEEDVSPADFYEFGAFLSEGVPNDANYPALKYAVGEWRYYLSEEDPETGGTIYNELGFADISLDYDRELVIAELHPRWQGDGYRLFPKEDPGYLPFTGGIEDNGALKLSGNATVIFITQYFACSGREYMMGEAWFSEEESGLFLLTRGQR